MRDVRRAELQVPDGQAVSSSSRQKIDTPPHQRSVNFVNVTRLRPTWAVSYSPARFVLDNVIALSEEGT